ncbi:MAG: ComF family protein [Candidatus Omnitrophota bacterium]
MKQFLRNCYLIIINLIYPIKCQICGNTLEYYNLDHVCYECFNKIKIASGPFCLKCGIPISSEKNMFCGECLTKKYNFQRAWQCCALEGAVQELIYKFKYQKKLFLKSVHSKIMYDFIKKHIDIRYIDALVPVPMKRSQIRKRGYNQAMELSKSLAKITKLPSYNNCIIKVKNTKQQMKLKKNERINNIKAAFAIKNREPLKNKNILLIDDVFTTGATTNECAKTLLSGGAKKVWVLALARKIQKQ